MTVGRVMPPLPVPPPVPVVGGAGDIGRLKGLSFEAVPTVGPLPVGPNSSLSIRGISQSGSFTIAVVITGFREDGSRYSQIQTITPLAGQTQVTGLVQLPAGSIASVSFKAFGVQLDGLVWVYISVREPNGSSTIETTLLCNGWLSQALDGGWPTPGWNASTEFWSITHSDTQANPAAGVSPVARVPVFDWLIQSVFCVLTTSAVAGNRVVSLVTRDNIGNLAGMCTTSVPIPASTVAQISFNRDGQSASPIATIYNVGIGEVLAQLNGNVQILGAALDAGDQFSAIVWSYKMAPGRNS